MNQKPRLPKPKWKSLKISYRMQPSGFEINVFDSSRKKYSVTYPSGIFENLNEEARNIIAENYVYARTRPLKLMADKLIYDTGEPFLRKFVDYGILEDMSRVSDIKRWPTKDLLEKIKESGKGKIIFKKKKSAAKLIPAKPTSPQKAILALSFGKDSLLSYGLAKEIGLECEVAFDLEMEQYNRFELQFKKEIIKLFSKEHKMRVHLFSDNVDEIFYKKETKQFKNFENANGMLAFTLELIPFVYKYGARYLIFGNERNVNHSFINHDGFEAYPSYDQSMIYTAEENAFIGELTGGNVQIVSLVESIYNLAEIKILCNRYPHLLKYVMSCTLDRGSKDRWCYACIACAETFLYFSAVGGDPEKIGFKKNFFLREYARWYALFYRDSRNVDIKPPEVRSEELLAFLMAYRRGCRGDLIEMFRKKYLDEAEKREKELRKQFFGINKAVNIPPGFKNRLLKIYGEELKPFQ